MTLKNNRSSLLCHIKLWASFQSHRWIQTGVTARKRSIQRFFVPCDLEIWWMTLKNNRAPLLCCVKLCASFHSHRWIITKATVRKRSIRVKISDLLSRVTVKFDGWPWKNSRTPLLRYFKLCASFVAIGELELKAETPNLSQNRRFVEPHDFEIWRMTLKNNRATSIFMHHFIIICEFKLELQSGNR